MYALLLIRTYVSSFQSAVLINRKVYNSIDCIIDKNVLNKNLLLISDEILNYRLADDLLKLEWPKTVITLSNYNFLRKQKGTYILFPDSNTTNYNRFFEVTSIESSHKRYIIFTESIFSMYNIFDISWIYKIIDIIAVFRSNSNELFIYTYYPFSSYGCRSSQPVLIMKNYSCNSEIRLNLFSYKRKLNNFHGCPLTVTIKEEKFQNDIKDDVPTKLLDLMKLKMNFTSEITSMNNDDNAYAAAYQNFTTASVLSVARGISDFGIGRYSQILDYHRSVIIGKETTMDCFTWAVPIKAGRSPSIWTVFIKEFDKYIWLLILIIFIIMSLIFYINNNKRINLYKIFAIFIGNAVKLNIKSDTKRLTYAYWLLYSFIIVSAYQACLGSLVIVPAETADIDTTSDLLKSDLELKSIPKIYYILSSSRETSDKIKQVLNRFELLLPDENFSQAIYQIFTDRNLAIFHTLNKLSKVEYFLKLKYNKPKIIHIIKKTCLITSHTSPVIMKRGSYLLKPINDLLTKLIESGLILYWEIDNTKNFKLHNLTDSLNRKPMNLTGMYGGLAALSIGYLVAIVAFISEIVYNKCFHHH
ncbi:hypothetical protein O3M35_010041 [Rhynocoris fuscipes]|uniref:Uncharacterized protein n=1 Tax=Rhynocoris fuscipes TaxID=488301 RepID=A0AAW1CXG6_9HEMI